MVDDTIVDDAGTEEITVMVLERMENSLESLEQMTLDSINITDKLVSGINEIRKCVMEMKTAPEAERGVLVEKTLRLLQDLLSIAFTVNNVSHELEQAAVYQHETVNAIRQIVDYLYTMSSGF